MAPDPLTTLTATTLVAAVGGAAVPAGLALAALGLRPTPPARRPRSRGLAAARRALAGGARPGRAHRRAAAAVTAGALVWLASGWVVAVLVVPAAVLGLPALLRSSRAGAKAERLEALEEWTRRLAGVLDVGVGLEQAITVNLRSTPEPLRPAVQALVARLRARWRTEDALRAFAADLGDATGDLVAAALILGAQRRGTGLTRVLNGLADTVADEVRMRRQVEADRAKPRTTARAVTGITLVVLGLLALNGAYIAPYGDPLGQLVLTLLLGAYAAALAWMAAISRTRPAPRFLTGPTSVAAGSGTSDRAPGTATTPAEVG